MASNIETEPFTQFATVLDSISDQIVIFDVQGEMVYSNRAATSGDAGANGNVSLAELYTGDAELLDEHGAPIPYDDYPSTKARKGIATENNIFQLINRRTGMQAWYRTSAKPILDTNGEVSHVAITYQNITEKKSQQRKLDFSEQRYKTLVETAPEVIYTLNADGTIQSLNAAFEKISGWPREEWIGRPFLDIVHPDDFALALDKFRQGMRGEARSAFELRVRARSGRYLIGEVTPGPPLAVGMVWGIIRDVTEQVEINRGKQEFISLASHQLRTPLSIINMYSEFLLQQGLPQEEGRDEYEEAIQTIHEAGRRMATLISDILNVSRIESEAIHASSNKEDIMAIASDVVRETMPNASKKSITITSAKRGKIPRIETDRHLLRVVLQNLIANAIRYTPKRGSVHVNVVHTGPHVRVDVADTGCGIPASEHNKVFDRFYRGENAKRIEPEGTGLGLYIVKSFVERLNGSVSFISKENEGTTFSVFLPFERAANEGLEQPSETWNTNTATAI